MLRVLTLNIWNLSGDWRARRAAVLSVVTSVRAGCGVPAGGGRDRPRHPGGVAGARAGGLGRRLCRGAALRAARPVRQRHPVPPRPIESTTSVRLPHEPDEREVQRLVVHARTGGVDVFSTHLAWQLHDAALREQQVLALMDVESELSDPGAPVGPIVAGDFNAEPDSTAIRFLTGLQSLEGRSVFVHDSWRLAGDGGPGLTWSDTNPHAALDCEPEQRLDYIFSGHHGRAGTGRPLTCRVVADTPVDGTWPSDHFGVLAEFQT